MKKISLVIIATLVALGTFVMFPRVSGSAAFVQEQGTNTYAPLATVGCADYLTQYLFPVEYKSADGRLDGSKNLPEQVRKLQIFLNKTQGSNAFTGTLTSPNLPVTGYFGVRTTAAVKSFQHYFWPVILQPWQPYGLEDNGGTGLVYKTTRRWINMLSCPGSRPALPELSR